MRFELTASGSDDYGDYATVRIYFDDSSWLEIDAAHVHDTSRRPADAPYSEGATIHVHHADGTEEGVWNGFVMPEWYAKRLAKAAT